MQFKSTSGSMESMKPETPVLAGMPEKVQPGFIFCLFNTQNRIEAYILKPRFQYPDSRRKPGRNSTLKFGREMIYSPDE
jgi:hypothetical protein